MANKNFIVKNGIEVGSGVIDFPSGSVMLRRANSGSDRIRITSGSIIHDTNTVISGNLEVTGNFNIAGDINQTSVTTLDVTDKTITVANNAGSAANANNAGLIVDTGGTLPSLLYTSSGDNWNFNKDLSIAGLADAKLEITSNSGGDPTIIFNALQANRSALFRYLDNGSTSGGYYKYSHLTDEHQFGSATATNINLKIGDFKTTVFSANSSSSDWGNRGLVSSVQINAANRTFSGLVLDDTGSGDGAAIGFRYDGSGYKLELATAPSSGGALSTHLTIDRLGAITTSGHLDVANELTVGDTTILKDSGVVTIKAAPLGSTYGGGFNAITVTGTSSNPYTSTIGFSNYGETDAMVIKGANVGIGITAPYFPLHVQGPTGFNGEAKNNILAFDTASATTGTGGGIAFGGYTNGTGGDVYHFGNIQGIKENSTAGNVASAMIFSTRAAGATPVEQMRIDSSGRVGINQTPLSNHFALQVTGLGGASNDARAVYLKGTGNHTSIGGTGPTLVLQNTDSTANNIVKLSFESASSGETVSINAINTNHSSHYGDMVFNTRGSGGYSEKLRIHSNGDLHLSSGAANKGYIQLSTQSTLYAVMGGNHWGYLGYKTGGYHRWFGSDGVEDMRLDNSGNLGIGGSPNARLDISASVGVSLRFSSTYNYGPNRDWQINTNNYGSSNWGGWSLEQSTAQQGTPSVARIGVHANGNVGINMGGDASSGLTSINPATALHVGGDITVGSADAVGTSGTASIRFQNDNERSRITSNYASGGGGQLGFWTDNTSGTLLERVTIKNDGTKVTNNVREYYERIFITNNVAYTFDIDVKSIGASGQVLEVFAGYTHYSTSYSAVIKQIWTQRSTAQSDVVLLNNTVSQSTGNGGAWSFTYVDADTVRLTKSAGTYGGTGWGYILIRSPN